MQFKNQQDKLKYEFEIKKSEINKDMKGMEIKNNERLKEMDNNMELKKLEYEKDKINIENSNNQRKEEYNLKVKEI